MPTFEQQVLWEADSLFRAGNYEYAKIRYTKLRDEHPNTKVAERAQYYLGYVNVYYENPFANWEAALREFKLFASSYPDNDLIGEVNSWIRLLVVLQSFKQQYDTKNDRLQDLVNRQNVTKQQSSEASYDALLDAVRKCYAEKDSLNGKVKVLNEVIERIEKNP